MENTTLNGDLFTTMIYGGSANLKKNRTIVNDLNVFPIPDGDTGDNMLMTVNAGYNEAAGSRDDSIEKASASAAHGMLLGARGNSGVILSRIFAGIAEGFKGVSIASVTALGNAFSNGITQAYKAVSVPVEGTILTVYKDAVNYANTNITDESTMESYFTDFTKEIRRSLDRTPELLDVLKKAGVVDSGGAGLLFIAEGMLMTLQGKATDETDIPSEGQAPKKIDTSLFGPDSVLEFGYCTEFILRLQNSKTDIEHFRLEDLTDHLKEIGESVDSFIDGNDGTLVKVHVHTMHPGDVLNWAQKFGEFLTVKIENMTLQHHNSEVKNRMDEAGQNEEEEKFRFHTHKKYATVAVASGDGLSNTFKEMGTDIVVNGGQSMNPSANELINAFDRADADTIFVLPNNSNIILTAKQAGQLYTKSDIRVIESHDIGQGYAAMSMLDYNSDDTETILSEAYDAMKNVVTGAISSSVRDTESCGFSIKKGDFLGFVGDEIFADCTDRKEAVISLVEKVNASGFDVVLLVCGQDANSDEADELLSELKKKYKRTEFIKVTGNQPIYDYLVIFE